MKSASWIWESGDLGDGLEAENQIEMVIMNDWVMKAASRF